MKRHSRRIPGLAIHFTYWIYVWTNMGLKYWSLRERDVALCSVGKDFDFSKLIEQVSAGADAEKTASRDGLKASHQARYTGRALRMLVEKKLGKEARGEVKR